MKKSVILLGMACAMVFASCKNDASSKIKSDATSVETTNETVTAGKYPVITFEKVEHDFGTIEQGTNVETVFAFTNTGDAPLVITNASSSCGCTVPEKPNGPIAPGEKGEIKVHFNGSGQNLVTKIVTLTANTQAGQEQVRIKAFVSPKTNAGLPNLKITQ